MGSPIFTYVILHISILVALLCKLFYVTVAHINYLKGLEHEIFDVWFFA